MTQERDATGRFAGRDVNRVHLRAGETIAGLSASDEMRLELGREVIVDGDAPAPGDFGGGIGGMTGQAPVKPEKSFSEVLRDAVDSARTGRGGEGTW